MKLKCLTIITIIIAAAFASGAILAEIEKTIKNLITIQQTAIPFQHQVTNTT